MAWYVPKHVVVTGHLVVTRCIWRVFTDVCTNGTNFIPHFLQFQSVPANRLAPSLGSLPPVLCIRTSTFRAIIFYTLKKEAKNPPKWYLYVKLHGVTFFLKFMDRKISTFSRKGLLHGVGHSLSAEPIPVCRHSKLWNWELRRGILCLVV